MQPTPKSSPGNALRGGSAISSAVDRAPRGCPASWRSRLLVGAMLALTAGGSIYFLGLAAPGNFPDMSSLDSGPMGSKLLFDTLEKTPPLAVVRNYLPLPRWRPRASALFLFSYDFFSLDSLDADDLAGFETLLGSGNRLIFFLEADSDSPRREKGQKSTIKKRWGIEVDEIPAPKNAKDKDSKQTVIDADSSWRPVNGAPNAMEKIFPNGGALVFVLRGEDFSNENLGTNGRALNEIAPLLAGKTAIEFDEAHLGIEESGSVAGLARQYKLEGLIVGLILTAALFIWKQSVSFPPPATAERIQEQSIQGADARSTLAALITRHLTGRRLIESCIAEWNRLRPDARITAGVSGESDPAAAYRQLQESLPKKRSHA